MQPRCSPDAARSGRGKQRETGYLRSNAPCFTLVPKLFVSSPTIDFENT